MTIEELRAYQLAQMELLDETEEICRKMNLTYYLIGGTLLGAVRHKGFIPWDPDIDIAMPRKDYEEFLKYWVENPSEKFFYQHYTTEKNHLSPHAVLKIRNTKVVQKERNSRYKPEHEGIYLDVFPLDNPPPTPKEQKRQEKKIRKMKRIIEVKAGYLYSTTSVPKKWAKRIVQFFLSPFSFSFLNATMDRCMKQYSAANGKYLVSMASHYSYWKQLMPYEIYGKPTKVLFEGKWYNAPAETDAYLTRIYKDYMKLPAEENLYAILDYIERVEYRPESEE